MRNNKNDPVQAQIDAMLQGDQEAICRAISSSSVFLVANSIIQGVQHDVTKEEFLSGLKDKAKSEETVLNCRIDQLALAALHVLGVQKYNGDDDRVLAYIDCNMNF